MGRLEDFLHGAAWGGTPLLAALARHGSWARRFARPVSGGAARRRYRLIAAPPRATVVHKHEKSTPATGTMVAGGVGATSRAALHDIPPPARRPMRRDGGRTRSTTT